MSPNELESSRSPRVHRWAFRVRSLFTLTLVAALYSAAFCLERDMRHLFLLIATFVLVGAFGIGSNRTAWLGFMSGAALGAALWWCVNYLEPLYSRDRMFYLVVFTAFVACVGMFAGFLRSLSRRK